MARKIDRWPELCDLVRDDDGLPVRESNYWSEQKLHFWNRYIDITTSAMVGHPKWPEGLVYVDLFAGPGVCRLDNSGKRFPGSPLIAAHASKEFRRILLCEKDPKNADACSQRLQQVLPATAFTVFRGDCNSLIDEITSQIPNRALTLAFIDPTGLHAQFETLSKLAECGRVDLLILFPDAVDVLRNYASVYWENLDSNLDHTLGNNSRWREEWAKLGNSDGPTIRRFFASIYIKQLQRLGYVQFGEKTIESPNGPLYRLIYASKSERGLEFWDKIAKKDLFGQRGLF